MAFVAPTESFGHSMLRPGLLSLLPFHAFSSTACSHLSLTPPSSLPHTPPHTCSSSEKEEREMERLGTALKNRFRREVLRSEANHEGMGAAGEVERGALFGDDFSVDDLLDFGGIVELEEKEAEEAEGAEAEPFQVANTASAVSLNLLAPAEIEFPNDDVEELEWVSRFFDDSFMELSPCSEIICAPSLKRPIDSMESLAPVKAKRSKRSRAAGGGVWSTVAPLALADSSSTSSNSCLSSSSFSSYSSSSSSSTSSTSSSSCLIYDAAAPGFATPDLVLLAGTPPPAKKDGQKKRGRRPKRPKPQTAGGGGERRCSHCGAQKTPQWRAGPLGAKTLCNACGVRFKSGRLLPEYRPACSPTFVSHVHSNSHRKVLEMRRQKEEQQHRLLSASSVAAAAAPAPVPSFRPTTVKS